MPYYKEYKLGDNIRFPEYEYVNPPLITKVTETDIELSLKGEVIMTINRDYLRNNYSVKIVDFGDGKFLGGA